MLKYSPARIIEFVVIYEFSSLQRSPSIKSWYNWLVWVFQIPCLIVNNVILYERASLILYSLSFAVLSIGPIHNTTPWQQTLTNILTVNGGLHWIKQSTDAHVTGAPSVTCIHIDNTVNTWEILFSLIKYTVSQRANMHKHLYVTALMLIPCHLMIMPWAKRLCIKHMNTHFCA